MAMAEAAIVKICNHEAEGSIISAKIIPVTIAACGRKNPLLLIKVNKRSDASVNPTQYNRRFSDK
jgi:predicted small lipoprotein YifL